MRGKMLLFNGILAASWIAFFFIPGAVEKFSLSPRSFFSGEYWRLLTYSLVHSGAGHLLGNIASLTLVAMIAWELKVSTLHYSAVYSIPAVFGVLPLWLIVQFTAMGASVALYALLGFVLLKIREYGMRSWYLFVLAAVPYQFLIAGAGKTEILQALSHFSGLIIGVGLFFAVNALVLAYENKKHHCLRFDMHEG